jgi:hypothetical protein
MVYGPPMQVSGEPDVEGNLMDPAIEAEVKDHER